MVIELEVDDILRSADLLGAKLMCLAGALWVTVDGDRNDAVLQAGGSYLLARQGIIAQAIRPSRIEVQLARRPITLSKRLVRLLGCYICGGKPAVDEEFRSRHIGRLVTR
jgi:hypothetical protein